MRLGRSPLLLGAIVLLLAACGGGDDDSGQTETGTDEVVDGNDSASEGASAGGATHGFVTVDGETYEFSYDTGTCGQETDGGRVFSQGFTDDGRQVVFSYGLAADTPDGTDVLQIIVYDADVQQQWYSAVGWGGSDVGSVSSLSKSGNTVTAAGQLQEAGGQALADFTAEATCNQ